MRTWRDNSIVEKDRLLGVVACLSDVAHWIVGVAQVLEKGTICSASRLQAGQAEGERIVGIGCAHAIAVLYKFALSLGVVVQVLHEGCRICCTSQPDVEPLQQVR